MKHLVLATGFAVAAVAVSAEEVAPDNVAFEEGVVVASLTGVAGDPVEGRKVFSNRKLGNCLACHENADMPEELFHGEVGPALEGAAERWDVGQLRGIVTNAKMTFEDTIMPAFYRTSGLTRPMEKFESKPILTAQQVEDVVAYLQTLK